MKAAQNGVPNMSVLDGWWDEGYEGDNGWAIGTREIDPDEAAQDWRDAQDLYRILEEEIIPTYYQRDGDGLPRGWLKVMRRAMASALWRFSSTRMLREYTESLYLPGERPAEGVAPEAAGSDETLADAAKAAASADEPALDETASPVGTDAG